jgi:hypothetical protein
MKFYAFLRNSLLLKPIKEQYINYSSIEYFSNIRYINKLDKVPFTATIKNKKLFSYLINNYNLFYMCNYLFKNLKNKASMINAKTFSFGFFYLRGLVVILFIDACLTDDEPLWEPIE